MVRLLRNNDLLGSMGRVGACGDNAAMESFFSLLQKNVLDTKRWETHEELRLAIVVWIETNYNRRRRQRALGKLTPAEFETIYTAAEAPENHPPRVSTKPGADPSFVPCPLEYRHLTQQQRCPQRSESCPARPHAWFAAALHGVLHRTVACTEAASAVRSGGRSRSVAPRERVPAMQGWPYLLATNGGPTGQRHTTAPQVGREA